ncbi:MAG TPA: chemotaxis protein CheB [Capillimicrobium sp.]
MTGPTRIAVCEDSRTYVHALSKLLQADGDIEVVGRFGSAEDLLAALPSLQADLVTMDLELPGLDGVAATRRIMADRPLPVVVLSSHTGRGSEQAAEALAAGAVDVLHKGDVTLRDVGGPDGAALRRRMRRLSRLRVAAPPRATARARGPRGAVVRGGAAAGARAIGIVASTGGPSALRGVLSALPAGFDVPVLVVQHMTAGFTDGLGRWLDAQVAAPVRLAVDGAPLAPGVWLAPDHADLIVDAKGRLRLDQRPSAARHPHRPSGDALFSSMATVLGARALAVVLTGMGSDGADGVRDIVAAGGSVVVQTGATCAVPGMPRAALEAGAQSELDLDDIGPALARVPAWRSHP